MNTKWKSWNERALELLEEQQAERRLPIEEWIKKRLGWENWEALVPEAVRYAALEMKRRRRRGSGKVLPRGYDAESLGAEAVVDLFEAKGQLVSGWTRERLVKELERLIRRKVRLLASLKEGRVTERGIDYENEDEDEDERVGKATGTARAAKEVPDGSSNVYQEVVAREEAKSRARLKLEFEAYVKTEPELVAVFRCLWAGITKAAEIARKGGVEEKKVSMLRKRLERRMARFRDNRHVQEKPR